MPDPKIARTVAEARWTTARRARRALVYVQGAALVLAGILVGRVYSVATAPEPPSPSPWWTVQIGPGGSIAGPVTLMGSDGAMKLVLPPGSSIVRDGGGLRLVGEGLEIRNLQLVPQEEPVVPPGSVREG